MEHMKMKSCQISGRKQIFKSLETIGKKENLNYFNFQRYFKIILQKVDNL